MLVVVLVVVVDVVVVVVVVIVDVAIGGALVGVSNNCFTSLVNWSRKDLKSFNGWS